MGIQDFEDGPWKHNNLDNGANIIIAVPKPLCGAIVLGESVITYFNADQQKTVSLQHDVMTVRLTLIVLLQLKESNMILQSNKYS